jgi:lipopolysaccharide transport system permease protein
MLYPKFVHQTLRRAGFAGWQAIAHPVILASSFLDRAGGKYMAISQAAYFHDVAPNRSRLNPFSIFASAWQHRDLVFRMARREVETRYKGSLLGIVWSFLVPLMMVGVYTFVFSTIFKGAHFDLPPGHKAPFFMIVFAGMICMNLFCECIARAPGLMLGNVSYIKKVLFPLEILPVVVLISELFNVLVSSFILMVIYFFVIGTPPFTVLLLPIIIFPLFIMVLGLVWFISALGVYLRDMRQLITVLLGMMAFVSPLLYPLSQIPPRLLRIVYFNPLTVPLEQVRHALFWGAPPDWRIWAGYLAGAWLIAWVGLLWFTHAQRGFADVV